MGELVNFVLKICSLAIVIIIAGLRAGTGVDTRPKYRDEETLLSGAIWTHILITIGLIISAVSEESLCDYVHAYFLFAITVLLLVTGKILTITKFLAIRAARQPTHQIPSIEDRQIPVPDLPLPDLPIPIHPPRSQAKMYDKTYLGIGLLMIWASCFTCADFILIIVKSTSTK